MRAIVVIPVLIAALLLDFSTAAAGEAGWPLDGAAFTDEAPVCLAAFSMRSDSWILHNLPQCALPLSPCSTFKIPNALIGLDTDLLTGSGHEMAWDGQVHSRDVLNRDHDLASAIRHSVVWYFQEVARGVGPDRMQAALDAFEYGNRDISGGIDRFWLGDSLEISALEQVVFLRRLAAGALPVSKETQASVKALLLQDYGLPEGFRGTLYGKTGSCPMAGPDHGWFVGLLERDGDTIVFAVNVIGADRWGPEARRIAIRMLQQLP